MILCLLTYATILATIATSTDSVEIIRKPNINENTIRSISRTPWIQIKHIDSNKMSHHCTPFKNDRKWTFAYYENQAKQIHKKNKIMKILLDKEECNLFTQSSDIYLFFLDEHPSDQLKHKPSLCIIIHLNYIINKIQLNFYETFYFYALHHINSESYDLFIEENERLHLLYTNLFNKYKMNLTIQQKAKFNHENIQKKPQLDVESIEHLERCENSFFEFLNDKIQLIKKETSKLSDIAEELNIVLTKISKNDKVDKVDKVELNKIILSFAEVM